jgi:hypothetical protein
VTLPKTVPGMPPQPCSETVSSRPIVQDGRPSQRECNATYAAVHATTYAATCNATYAVAREATRAAADAVYIAVTTAVISLLPLP